MKSSMAVLAVSNCRDGTCQQALANKQLLEHKWNQIEIANVTIIAKDVYIYLRKFASFFC
jgi:hypothetical protein